MNSFRLHTVFVTAPIFLWAGLSSISLAGEVTTTPQGLSAGNGLATTVSMASSIGKVIGALMVIVVLMVVLIYFIKKTGLDLRGKKEGSLIQIIETRMIAPKKYISIVEIAGKYVSIGITDQNINLITELPESPALHRVTTKNNSTPFSGVLKKSMASLKAIKGKDKKQGNQ